MGDDIICYERADGKHEWRRVAENNRVVATSGSQGYETADGAYTAAEREMDTPVDRIIQVAGPDAIRTLEANRPGVRDALDDMLRPDPIDPDGETVGD